MQQANGWSDSKKKFESLLGWFCENSDQFFVWFRVCTVNVIMGKKCPSNDKPDLTVEKLCTPFLVSEVIYFQNNWIESHRWATTVTLINDLRFECMRSESD